MNGSRGNPSPPSVASKFTPDSSQYRGSSGHNSSAPPVSTKPQSFAPKPSNYNSAYQSTGPSVLPSDLPSSMSRSQATSHYSGFTSPSMMTPNTPSFSRGNSSPQTPVRSQKNYRESDAPSYQSSSQPPPRNMPTVATPVPIKLKPGGNGNSQILLNSSAKLQQSKNNSLISFQTNISEPVNNINEYRQQPGIDPNLNTINPVQKQVLEEKSRREAHHRGWKSYTTQRKIWLIIVWICTWWLPDFLLKMTACCSSKSKEKTMKNANLRMAFREKLALCILIALVNAIVVFAIFISEWLLCPETWKLYNDNQIAVRLDELANTRAFGGPVIARYGTIYRASAAPQYAQIADSLDISKSPRTDELTYRVCSQLRNSQIRLVRERFDSIKTLSLSQIKFTDQSPVGFIVYGAAELAARTNELDQGLWIAVDQDIFDLTEYFQGSYAKFFSPAMETFLRKNAGTVVQAGDLESIEAGSLNCFMSAYRIGKLDFRQRTSCVITTNISTALMCFVLLLLFVKFCAAVKLMSFGRSQIQYMSKKPSLASSAQGILNRQVTEQSKFLPHVLIMIPCYTEDKKALEKTILSVALADYPDHKKLLWIVCDGLCVGHKNGNPTFEFVMELLGISGSARQEALDVPYFSLADENQIINYAQVFTGRYYHSQSERSVQFVLCVKTGSPINTKEFAAMSPSELNSLYSLKPGNRGKRDSQAIVMRFLYKAYYKRRMTALELELRHQFEHLLQIDPTEYEYMLMVDADTEVSSNSIKEFVKRMQSDRRIMGICGETTVANAFGSPISMIQVFEYFISHSLSKAFESLFGTVTCLPGCFSMWKIADKQREMPILISADLIHDYAAAYADTLHEKNLLLLGEDRCLTSIMLKSFPGMTTKYTGKTACQTVVPTGLCVLISQRRRWINSTVHNLWELLSVKNLCGFCCMNMRFIVLLDLLSTFISPGSTLFLGYVVYQCIVSPMPPFTALFILGGIYLIQIILAILQGRFSQILWMVINTLAYPFFNFFLPIIAFWRFDNFKWGSTRKTQSADRKQIDSLEEEIAIKSTAGTGKPFILEYWNPQDLSWRSKYIGNNNASVAKSNTLYAYHESFITNVTSVAPIDGQLSPRKNKKLTWQ